MNPQFRKNAQNSAYSIRFMNLPKFNDGSLTNIIQIDFINQSYSY